MTRDEAAAIAANAGCYCCGKGYSADVDDDGNYTGRERYCDCPMGVLRRGWDAPTKPEPTP